MSWRTSDWPDAQELAAIQADAIAFAGVGLYRYTMDGTVVFLDQGAFDLLDLGHGFADPGAVIGMNIEELFTRVLPPHSLRDMVSEQGEVRGLEYPYRTLSGEERWAYHHAYKVKDPASGIDAVQVISQDITALKLSARALAASERQYRNLAEQSLQGLIVVQGSPASIRFVNTAASVLIGPASEEIERMGLSGLAELFHPDERGWWEVQLRRLREARLEVERRDLRLMQGEVVERWLTVLSGPIEYQGGYAFQIVLADDTDRHRAQERRQQVEERMRQAQKLESLGVLAGGIAHDFNNLLATILGNTELAASSIPRRDPSIEKLDRVRVAASRATELCQQLLAYSGKGLFSVETIDLRTLILDTVELLKVSIASSIRLSFKFENDLPLIAGEPSQLRQVFMNLLTNASEAVEERRRRGGLVGDASIRFSVRRCELDAAVLAELAPGEDLTPGTYALVEVEDEGEGIDSEVVHQIFEPFYTTKFAGRGLGLAAVKGIMAGHNGAIKVRSRPKHGTCFMCYFPAAESAAVAAPVEAPQDSRPDEIVGAWQGRGTALVVDDEPAVRTMAADLLEFLGFETVEVSSGTGAIGFLQRASTLPCFVLLDLTMPGISGHETFAFLRKMAPGLPILFSSGFDQRSLTIDLRRERSVCFLKKPYGVQELHRSLSQLLGQEDG